MKHSCQFSRIVRAKYFPFTLYKSTSLEIGISRQKSCAAQVQLQSTSCRVSRQLRICFYHRIVFWLQKLGPTATCISVVQGYSVHRTATYFDETSVFVTCD